MEWNKLSISELQIKLRNNELTSEELTISVLKQIKNDEKHLNAFITIMEDYAIKQAKEIDKKLQAGEKLSPLAGIPIAIKDNICVKDFPMTCGSKILESFISPYNATAIKRLLDADAIIIGKTNMDEFAMGSSNENSHFNIVHNPHNLEYVPGGSSGGSAATVSANGAIIALGSETGGSVRQPAAFCGVIGAKPTYGRVSRYGLVAFASSLDQIGTLGRTVHDAALVLQTIAGIDEYDSTSAPVPVDNYLKELNKDIAGLTIGIPKEFFIEGIHKEIREALNNAIEIYKSLGANIIDVSLPHTKYGIPTYCIIAMAEASSNLARYDGVKYGYRTPNAKDLQNMYFKSRSEGFGEEVKRRIMLGTYALSSGYYDAYYLKAQKVRTLIKKDFDIVFEKCDALLAPTTPTPAFKIGEKANNPLEMYLSDILTATVNLSGVPAISIPCGFTKQKLPIGMQIITKHFEEAKMFRIAAAYEQMTKENRNK